MATSFPLRFIGDLGNRNEFFGSLRNGAAETVSTIKKMNVELAAAAHNISLVGGSRQAGFDRSGVFKNITALRTEMNALDDVFKMVSKVSLVTTEKTRNASGRFNLVSEEDLAIVEKYTGSVKKFNQASEEYERAFDRLHQAQSRDEREIQFQENRANTARQGISSAFRARMAPLEAIVAQKTPEKLADYQYRILQQQIIANNNSGKVRTNAENEINRLVSERATLIGRAANAQARLNALNNQYTRALATDATILDAESKLTSLRARTHPVLESQVRAAQAAQRAAIEADPDLPANYRNLQSFSPKLIEDLQRKQGLKASGREFYEQEGQISAIRANLQRGTFLVSGSHMGEIETRTGPIKVLKEWSAELDKNGNQVTRFGGQLSGVGNMLRQISRDFVKVIEWTVATTVVFGTLQAVMGQISNIKQLDTLLQRFAVTAALSPKEATASFQKLGDIAVATATPLAEIVGAADDIALATKKSGQSTEQWAEDIYNLTEAVGIFTNLTGVDTVKATDLLTAAMKQLGLQTTEIPFLLSKITAVAGGQANAISDITQGLAVMAEAGKQAGLAVDQQIAIVQTLSQVTTKSPAEVATSFKNLVGSLGSPGALKVLKEFGIEVRTQQGDLRNILEVYGDIADKIRTGVIGSGDIQRVIRGISGGPRRAPDAAALLAALSQIETAQKRAAAATNEAAIANAKALDTTNARLIQLQNKIGIETFNRFRDTLKDLTNSLLTFADTLLTVFSNIPTALIAASVQLLAMGTAIRLGIRLVGALATAFRGVTSGIYEYIKASVAARLATAAIAGPVAAGGAALGSAGLLGKLASFAGPVLGKLGGVAGLGSAGLSGLLGAGITAASGGNGLQSLGGGLQGLGLGLVFNPITTITPWAKVGGAALAALGTIIQFTAGSKEAADSTIEDAAKIVNAYDKLRDSALNLGELKLAQRDLGTEIENLQGKANKTGLELLQLKDYQKQYSDNMFNMAQATRDVDKAIQELLASGKFAGMEQAFSAARRGQLNPQDFEKLIRDQELVLLKVRNPGLDLPEKLGLLSGSQIGTGSLGLKGGTSITLTGDRNPFTGEQVQNTVALKDYVENATNLKSLFAGGELSSAVTLTGESFDILSKAIQELALTEPDAANGLRKILNTAATGLDSITAFTTQLELLKLRMDILSFLDPEQEAQLGKLLTLARLLDSVMGVDSSKGEGDRHTGVPGVTTLEELRNRLTQSLATAAEIKLGDPKKLRSYYLSTLEPILEDVYKHLDPKDRGKLTLVEFISDAVTKAGFKLEELGLYAKDGYGAVGEAAQQAAEDILATTKKLEADYAQKSGQLQIDIVNKNVTPKRATELRGIYDFALKNIPKVGDVLSTAFETDRNFEITFAKWEETLTKIPGLENAANLSAAELIQRFFDMAEAGNLSQKQFEAMIATLLNLQGTLDTISKIRAEFKITANFTNLQELLEYLQLMKTAAAQGTGRRAGGQNRFSDLVQAQSQTSELDAAIARVKEMINKQTPDFTPNPLPIKPTGTKADIGSIFLNEQQQKLADPLALVKKSFEEALKIQSEIPGETKKNAKDIVVVFDGLKKIFEARGVSEELLAKRLDENTKALIETTKADKLGRIRVGVGDFAALVNTPFNSRSGVSVGGPGGPITVNLNVNGQLMTQAQLIQAGNVVAAQMGLSSN